ncbi:HAMP domain-containing protein [Planomonospora sp. ID67723]|uniref:sensor histidine kinase n=1 Tax=Planomonospora sp. ID67723 TaxID=2738134 RepID=UPI0018C3D4DE|nr:sensor histidine kinase [Planomonospora sp. ID67723]MBG0833354.1 HAMP domain-containing protein [Planomonospora sp. ID67723]
MKWLNRSVGRALRGTFGLLVALVLLSGVVATIESTRQSEALNQLFDHNLPLRLNNLKLRSTMGDATRGLRNYLLYEQSKATYQQARATYPPYLEALVERSGRPEERPLIEDLRRKVLAWFDYASRAEQVRPGEPQVPQYAEGSRLRYEEILRASDTLEAQLTRRTVELEQQGARNRFWGTVTTLVFAVLAGAMALLTALRAYQALVPPLAAMGDTLGRLAAGDHTARVPSGSGPTEIRQLGAAINMLADESDRLRDAERERARLGKVAHEAAARIRRTLDAEQVVHEAVAALGAKLPADQVFVQLIREGMIGPAEMEWSDGRVLKDGMQFPAVPAGDTEDLYLRGATPVGSTSDPPDYVPEAPAGALRRLGDKEFLLVPFGVGDKALGSILLTRASSKGAWSTDEMEAVKVVGTDLGRGLDQARLYGRERELVKELRALDSAKTDFMSTVSHELRSPLTSIAGYLEILRDEEAGEVNPAQDRMLDAIERNTTRLRLLIEDLLTLSRIEAGAFRSLRQRTDLCAVVEGAVTAMRPTADKAQVGLHIDCPDDSVAVDGDPNQLDRAMANLLSNAVKFTRAGGNVNVKVTVEDDQAVVTVADTGIGIPKEEMSRLSTRFFRASNATELSIPGTGLGLSIVRSIVANHSGTFDLRSEEGKGTEAAMRIPVCANEKGRPDAPRGGGEG